jgi:beta-lactamase class D OXA-2
MTSGGRRMPLISGALEKSMGFRMFKIVCALFFLAPLGHAQERAQERSEWIKYFEKFDAKGTMVVADERATAKAVSVYDEARARTRYLPASTFKIPHALFALDAGYVRDEFQVFRWDGVERSFKPHNQDQDLRSSMRNSAVWVFQRLAKDIGSEKARHYLRQIGYGNADPSGGTDGYWLDGNLRVSAHEQIAFLRRLYRNELPFRTEHQRLVKDTIIAEAGRDWILRAKTGWEGRIGWWVGWVEWPAGPVFFALNIDTPNRMADLQKREAIARAILRSIGALPTD